MSLAVPTGRFEWERLVRRAVLPKPVKLAALILATYADPDGTRIRPGMDTLAAVTGDSERNARRMVDKLENHELLTLVKRGGGRGGKGTASEYQLTIPSDYLERFDTLGPDERRPDRPDTQMSGETDPDPVDNSPQPPESPDTQMSAQSDVDNSNDRTSRVTSDGMTGHLASIDRTSRCPTTTHDHPPKETTTVGATRGESRPRARHPPSTSEAA